ncbi:hypothetical protein [Clostridium sporogenes]|uniref:hypothetical protein n=1 Tax=Clostridium sporogenes TaxID=1509 RepID=UPI001F375735|nr:hypothetical protein [Clostridium sporogenes]UJA30889.1 hypothetical protein L0894_12280 [Clostridium sporogenes]
MYKYFISYCINLKENGLGFGNAELDSSYKITQKETLDEASRKLEQMGELPEDSITIMNFKRFEEE